MVVSDRVWQSLEDYSAKSLAAYLGWQIYVRVGTLPCKQHKKTLTPRPLCKQFSRTNILA